MVWGFFLNLPVFSCFFFSLDGKKEFTPMDAPSTLTTVRRRHLTTSCLLSACIWSCVSYTKIISYVGSSRCVYHYFFIWCVMFDVANTRGSSGSCTSSDSIYKTLKLLFKKVLTMAFWNKHFFFPGADDGSSYRVSNLLRVAHGQHRKGDWTPTWRTVTSVTGGGYFFYILYSVSV